MEGMESGCVILVQNSGSVASTTATGVSRARSRLIIFSPKEDETMIKAADKNLVGIQDSIINNFTIKCFKVEVNSNRLDDVRKVPLPKSFPCFYTQLRGTYHRNDGTIVNSIDDLP